jgi:hypothetical protein
MARGWFAPVITIEPTTAIAEMALVKDIIGVCSSRETRLMTSRPMKVASKNTKSKSVRSEVPGAGSEAATAATAATGAEVRANAATPVQILSMGSLSNSRFPGKGHRTPAPRRWRSSVVRRPWK